MIYRAIVILCLFGAGFGASGLNAAAVAADSERGAALFTTLACVQCHSVNGKGGTVGPDLGRSIDRDFTPATLAATMWNHAPAMWASMRALDLRPGDLNEQGAADLFAFFYSARFFEKPGDAARGKRLFSENHCSECHALTEAKGSEAPPVSKWDSIGQPIALVTAMWNHAATMRQEFGRKKLRWPELTAQDLTDILVYLRGLPASRNAPVRVDISSGANGQALFESQGCAACHTGKNAIGTKIKGETLTDIAATMWNHEPKMPPAPGPLALGEMRDIVSYLWAGQFFEDAGSASTGARVFTAKHCAVCHNDPSSGAPKLTEMKRTFTSATMVSALWHHGPAMLDQMKAKGIAWPRFNGAEMANLIAYLNAKNGGN
ncbi:MAG TPA: c-type cytochrome [Bryobacteraceae bacterium]|jgi:mono/diheme cytochrome c family protein